MRDQDGTSLVSNLRIYWIYYVDKKRTFFLQPKKLKIVINKNSLNIFRSKISKYCCVTTSQTRFYCDHFPTCTFLLAKQASLYVITGQKIGCHFKRGTSSFDWTWLCGSILIRIQIDLGMPPLLSTGQLCIAAFVPNEKMICAMMLNETWGFP